LEHAIKQLPASTQQSTKFNITFQPYLLDPTLDSSKPSQNKLQRYRSKFGPRVDGIIENMKSVGRDVGIKFSWDGLIGSTVDSHRLIEYADRQGKQDALVNTLFKAYFEDAQDINNKEVTDDCFKGKKVVVFGTPGAYTPVCTNQHLPSFVENADKLKEAGVDAIVCVAVNDPFVLKAWSEQLKADGKVTVLSDWNAALVKNLGLDIDLSAAGLGVRSKRFSLIIDNGKITHQNVEAKPGDFTVTGADTILQQLGRK